MTLFQGYSDLTFSNCYFSETTRPIEAKFHVAHPWDEGMKVNTNALYHITKMAAMPVSDKNFKNLLLWNQKVDDLETWYAALVTGVLQI